LRAAAQKAVQRSYWYEYISLSSGEMATENQPKSTTSFVFEILSVISGAATAFIAIATLLHLSRATPQSPGYLYVLVALLIIFVGLSLNKSFILALSANAIVLKRVRQADLLLGAISIILALVLVLRATYSETVRKIRTPHVFVANISRSPSSSSWGLTLSSAA
jgi:hypothetical protein